MQLERVTHIEGLEDAYQNVELEDDTPPDACLVRFYVVAEDMPFKSAQEGRKITQNFVYVHKTKDLGQMDQRRRVYDDVLFDEATGKWKIKRLAEYQSDIKRYPNEWNAFMRGHSVDDFGTPLSLLFKNDPARVSVYERHGIVTIDRLSRLGDAEIQMIGMGARDDVQKAVNYIERSKSSAPLTELMFKLEERDKQVGSLEAQLADLSNKMAELLKEQIENAKPKQRKSRTKLLQEPVA